MKALQLLLKYGASVHARNEVGMAALHLTIEGASEIPFDSATERHYLDAVNLLLQHGADINAMDAKGETALQKAESGGMEKLELLFLKAGADAKDIYGLRRLFS